PGRRQAGAQGHAERGRRDRRHLRPATDRAAGGDRAASRRRHRARGGAVLARVAAAAHRLAAVGGGGCPGPPPARRRPRPGRGRGRGRLLGRARGARRSDDRARREPRGLGHLDLPRLADRAGVTVERKRNDLGDLRRHTLIWIGALLWLGLGYAFQDPAKDPYDAAERAAFSYAMLVVIPLVTGIFVFAWVNVLRRRRA